MRNAGNVDPVEGALEELQRLIGLIREKWPTTHILVRGDSAYAREEIMKFCEGQKKVDYVLAMATNNQLKLRAFATIEKAKKDYEQRLEPVIKLMELSKKSCYQSLLWKRGVKNLLCCDFFTCSKSFSISTLYIQILPEGRDGKSN